MILTVFRTRLRPGIEAELEPVGARMYELASSMPGFVSYREYQSADGESVAIVEFESKETLAAWRKHPEHLAAQASGRNRWFADYRIQVCEVVREYSFKP
jgi:heme-degrading monooxygenase HmoA